MDADLKRTPLYDLHVDRGARMVPFAGYAMPVQYAGGIIQEHQHTRAAAGLFDVSHMGQVRVSGADAAAAFERLVPGDIQGLGEGRMRYTQFTDEKAGILDDLMVTHAGDHLFVVINAACKEADIARMREGLPKSVSVEPLAEQALIALQGPQAAAVLDRHASTESATMPFMSAAAVKIAGIDCFVSRSGYTGEDGYEISCPAESAAALAEVLLGEAEVEPVGLGARDTLRLEAGLCLYGNDIDATTTPVEAALTWSIGKRRREEGGFPGDAVVRRQLAEGVARKRVGLKPEGRAPVRGGAELQGEEGGSVGHVTSGGFGPTVGGPVAMGYVATALAKPGTELAALVRGKPQAVRVARLPFVEQRYYRG